MSSRLQADAAAMPDCGKVPWPNEQSPPPLYLLAGEKCTGLPLGDRRPPEGQAYPFSLCCLVGYTQALDITPTPHPSPTTHPTPPHLTGASATQGFLLLFP